MNNPDPDTVKKIDPKALVIELNDLLYNQGNFMLFFPEDFRAKIEENFKLFDRDEDYHLSFEEVKVLLVSVDVKLPESDTQLLYDELADEKGLSLEKFYLFIVKKKRDDNKEAELLKSFLVLDKGVTGFIKDADDFKDLMMMKGVRMLADEVNQMMEGLNPKGKDEFEYKEFCKVVGASDEGKKKKKKKKGKKKKK